MFKKISVISLSFMLLAGCSTGYQKSNGSEGYREMKLSSNSYTVEYNSNSYTDRNTNERHALRRAAELCQENGFKYFKITKTTDTSETWTTPITIDEDTQINAGSRSIQKSKDLKISGGQKVVEPGVAITMAMANDYTDGAYEASVILSNFQNKDK